MLWTMTEFLMNPDEGPGWGERAMRRALGSLVPAGWIDFNKAALSRSYTELTRAADPRTHQFFPQQFARIEEEFVREKAAHPFNPHRASGQPRLPRGVERRAAFRFFAKLGRSGPHGDRARALPARASSVAPIAQCAARRADRCDRRCAAALSRRAGWALHPLLDRVEWARRQRRSCGKGRYCFGGQLEGRRLGVARLSARAGEMSRLPDGRFESPL